LRSSCLQFRLHLLSEEFQGIRKCLEGKPSRARLVKKRTCFCGRCARPQGSTFEFYITALGPQGDEIATSASWKNRSGTAGAYGLRNGFRQVGWTLINTTSSRRISTQLLGAESIYGQEANGASSVDRNKPFGKAMSAITIK
jgi:hypothetical protein